MAADDRRRAARLVAAALLVAALGAAIALLVGTGGSRRARTPATTASAPAPTQTNPRLSQTSTTTTGPATPASIGPPAQPPPGTEQFGVNVNYLFNGTYPYTNQELGAQLEALRQTGATVARTDSGWGETEPQAPVGDTHHYDWSYDDSIAASLAGHGLRWLPIIDYTAPWAESIPGASKSAPTPASAYAAYAGAFAARYGQGGSFWSAHPSLPAEPIDTYEIWNEPDNGEFWSPAPDAAGYVDLYLRARDAITAVDPSARVIVGGLSNPGAFLPAMVHARPDLLGHIDGVAIHPYGTDAGAVLGRVRGARSTLESLGLGTVPLYVTEFGWTTHPPGALAYLPEQLRPEYILRTVAALGHLDCGVAAAILYTWVTPQRDPANLEDWYGIHPPDGGTSSDTAAFTAGVRAASARRPPRRLCSSA